MSGDGSEGRAGEGPERRHLRVPRVPQEPQMPQAQGHQVPPGPQVPQVPGEPPVSGPAHPCHQYQEHHKHQEHPHTGNGTSATVNDPLDDQGPGGLDSDELELRGLLHQVVQDIEPRDGTLEHLRRAVPARRARKRQAAVGVAAAALFLGTAVPALVHVSNSTGSSADPSIAGLGQDATGGASEGAGPDGGSGTVGGSTGGGPATGHEGDQEDASGDDDSPGTTPGVPPGGPSPSEVPTTPVCTAAQLGGGTAAADVPDSAGTVYGTFRISNVSGESCTVTGPGTVTPIPLGAADPAKISVARHASGDVAAELPDPSTETGQLVLLPGAAYEVRFAWVPAETCPVEGGGTGGTGGPSPDPSPSADPGTTTGGSTGGDTGTSTQLVTEDGTADGSVQVSYTPEAGSESVSVVVPDACAGTVYRTGVLAGS